MYANRVEIFTCVLFFLRVALKISIEILSSCCIFAPAASKQNDPYIAHREVFAFLSCSQNIQNLQIIFPIFPVSFSMQ